MEHLGRRLKASRIEAGYGKPEDIAPLVGKSSRQVREYEKGTVQPPLAVLQRWAQRTGKSLAYFLGSEEVQPMNSHQPPDHPGVRALAADAQLCQRHHVTPAELTRLATLVMLTEGQAVAIETADQALALLQALRTVGPA